METLGRARYVEPLEQDYDDCFDGTHALAYPHIDNLKHYNRIHDVETNERARAVFADVISMVKRLGVQTLCEGVETEEQVAFLRAVGCKKAQGYFFGRPSPHDVTMQRLDERTAAWRGRRAVPAGSPGGQSRWRGRRQSRRAGPTPEAPAPAPPAHGRCRRSCCRG